MTNFPNGLKVQGFPLVLGAGNVFYVHHSGSNGNDGQSIDKPVATIDYAIGLCEANNGDIIIVLQGHAETVTSAITADIAGISIIGWGVGTQRPNITGNGTIDCINVTAANIWIHNLRFPAPETTAQTSDINVAAAGCIISDCMSIGSQTAKVKTDAITLASGADDCTIRNCRFYNTVVDAVSAISLEAAVARVLIEDCVVQGTYTTACLMDEALATNATIRRNLWKNTKTTGACMNFTNNSTGVCQWNHLSGRNTTIASNNVMGTSMDYFENRVCEEAILNGMILPVSDAD